MTELVLGAGRDAGSAHRYGLSVMCLRIGSATLRPRWLLDNARDDLGYRPVDDAEQCWPGWRGKHWAGTVPNTADEMEMCFR